MYLESTILAWVIMLSSALRSTLGLRHALYQYVGSRPYSGHTKAVRYGVQAVEVASSVRQLTVTTTDVNVPSEHGTSFPVDILWLRNHCSCDKCLHPVTNQKLTTSSDWTKDLTPESASLCESSGIVSVEWDFEHTSEFCLKELQTLHQTGRVPSRLHFPPALSLADTKAHFSHDEVMSEEKELFRFLSQVNRAGLAILRGTPDNYESVVSIANRLGGVQDTIYGLEWNVVDEAKPINIAYTSLELEPHIDLNYYESPPGLQLLHAWKFHDIVGGESTFIDGFALASSFKDANPEAYNALTKLPTTFHKWHLNRENPVHLEYQRPIIQTNAEGGIIGVNWSPPFEGPLRLRHRDTRPYYEAYSAFAQFIKDSEDSMLVEFKLNEGDTVVFNNRRILHGRRAFKQKAVTGVRHLRGAYVSIDEYFNLVCVLADKYSTEDLIYRVGNGNWS